MFGSVVAWFYRSLAGIRPDVDRPGMKHFFIAPSPVEELEYCKASYATLYGKVVSEWKKDEDGNLHLYVEIPVNTSATVILPRWGNSQVKVLPDVTAGGHEYVVER